MPTGYTANVMKQSFKEFAIGCARAFGALIELRDQPLDYEVTEKDFESDSYYSEKLKEAEREMKKLKSMTSKQLSKEATDKYNSEFKEYQKRKKETDKLKARYQEFIKLAEKWNPPTNDHKNVQDFMISQLTESIEWDCHEPTKPKLLSSQQYFSMRKKDLLRSILYYKENLEEDKQRNVDRKKWYFDYVKSLENIK